jgi:hypothetical protein
MSDMKSAAAGAGHYNTRIPRSPPSPQAPHTQIWVSRATTIDTHSPPLPSTAKNMAAAVTLRPRRATRGRPSWPPPPATQAHTHTARTAAILSAPRKGRSARALRMSRRALGEDASPPGPARLRLTPSRGVQEIFMSLHLRVAAASNGTPGQQSRIRQLCPLESSHAHHEVSTPRPLNPAP